MAVISCISLFFCKHEKPALRGGGLRGATKNPARSPARAAGTVSVNTLFWKILVTRVKRKVRAFDRGAFPGGRGPLRVTVRGGEAAGAGALERASAGGFSGA